MPQTWTRYKAIFSNGGRVDGVPRRSGVHHSCDLSCFPQKDITLLVEKRQTLQIMGRKKYPAAQVASCLSAILMAAALSVFQARFAWLAVVCTRR